jgi:hypothetical protein
LIDRAAVVTATGGASPRVVNELRLGGGSGASVLELRTDAVISAINGFSIVAGGVLRGDGVVDSGGTAVTSGGELRVDGGERLRLTSSSFTNQGTVQAFGTSSSLSEVEFSGPFTNAASTGLITGHTAILRFTGGLTNNGSLLLTSGLNDVTGDVNNNATGRIAVAGGAAATFYDDVIQNGTLQVLKVGATNSTAVFAGSFTGSGGSSGGGDIFFLGDLRPGHSPAAVTFDNNVGFDSGASLNVELGGPAAGSQFDQVNIGGQVSLDGALDVDLINGFMPAANDSFTVMTYGSRAGVFDTVALPTLPAGLNWSLNYGLTSLTLSVASTLLPGDIDEDGDVDPRDAAIFSQFFGRQTDSLWTTGDFNGDEATTLADWSLLQTHLGQSAPSPSAAVGVPEPSASWLAILSLALIGLRRRR